MFPLQVRSLCPVFTHIVHPVCVSSLRLHGEVVLDGVRPLRPFVALIVEVRLVLGGHPLPPGGGDVVHWGW